MDLFDYLLPLGVIIIIFLFLVGLFVPQISRKLSARRQLTTLEESHEKLRDHRREIQSHIDWAISRQDFKDAEVMSRERNRVDSQLEELRIQYECLKGD